MFFSPKIAAKSVIMVCIRFIICVVSFDDTKVRRIPSLKLGRISRRVVHSSLDAYFKMKRGAFYFRSRKHIGFKKIPPAFLILPQNKMMLPQSGLGRTLEEPKNMLSTTTSRYDEPIN
jgi:hypothetical protein